MQCNKKGLACSRLKVKADNQKIVFLHSLLNQPSFSFKCGVCTFATVPNFSGSSCTLLSIETRASKRSVPSYQILMWDRKHAQY